MIFAKFQSLTHKIDTMVIRDIKREMPLKYWSFKVAEWIARVGALIAIALVGFLVRGGLYVDLEKRILDKWQSYVQ
ncbi:hypothetical protein [Erwinia oleae]|uniref:hypothetical protein n=1 Tax=Erwinia oleae TaxID=796334 RepID=UPI00054E8F86|nr:hypothetical protein [Erwinia oleae]